MFEKIKKKSVKARAKKLRHAWEKIWRIFLSFSLLFLIKKNFFKMVSRRVVLTRKQLGIFAGLFFFALLLISSNDELNRTSHSNESQNVDQEPLFYDMVDEFVNQHQPFDCLRQIMSSEQMESGINGISIVIMPSHDGFDLDKYRITRKGITNSPLFNLFHLLIVNDGSVDEKSLKPLFESFSFEIVNSKTNDTTFQTMVDTIKGHSSQRDFMVFVTAGMVLKENWLEPLLDPFFKATHPRPLFTVPHFDSFDFKTREYLKIDHFLRLSFLWNMDPIWYQIPLLEELNRTTEANPIQTPIFLPHALAVKTNSKKLDRLLSMLKSLNRPVTTLDASQFIYRCLQDVSVYICPCSRVGNPNTFSKNIDPLLNDEKKKVLISKFIDTFIDDEDLKALAFKRSELVPYERAGTGLQQSCENFKHFLKNVAVDVVDPTPYQNAGFLFSRPWYCYHECTDYKVIGEYPCKIYSDKHVI